ncbi:MAG: hypothetical protein K6L80_11645 [Agarilytica sp.]
MKFFCILITLLSTAVLAETESKETINYALSKPGEFDIVFHRVDPAGAGAAAAGLIGAAIQTSHQNGKDKEKLEEIRPHITLDSCGDVLFDTFKAKIDKKSIPAKEITASDSFKKGDLILKIGIDACGFKLTNSVDRLMSSYVLGKMVLKRKGQKGALIKERLYLTGKQQFSFEKLLEESDQINTRIEKILKKAGKRVANKIIYL